MNAAGFARAVAESLTTEPLAVVEVTPDCVCLICRTHLFLVLLKACSDCGTPICPACDKHGHIAPFGTWSVPPQIADAVRATALAQGMEH